MAYGKGRSGPVEILKFRHGGGRSHFVPAFQVERRAAAKHARGAVMKPDHTLQADWAVVYICAAIVSLLALCLFLFLFLLVVLLWVAAL